MVSEIDEESATDTDGRLEAVGAVIFRCVRRDVMDAQIASDLDASLREVKRLEHELLQAQMTLKLAEDRFQTARERARYVAASIKGGGRGQDRLIAAACREGRSLDQSEL